ESAVQSNHIAQIQFFDKGVKLLPQWSVSNDVVMQLGMPAPSPGHRTNRKLVPFDLHQPRDGQYPDWLAGPAGPSLEWKRFQVESDRELSQLGLWATQPGDTRPGIFAIDGH